MKISLRLKLAWRILFHRHARVDTNYMGRVTYFVGLGGAPRNSLEITTRSIQYIERQTRMSETRIREGADQLGGILGGKINVG